MSSSVSTNSVLATLIILFFAISTGFAQTVPDDPTKVTPILINATIPDVSVKTIENKDVRLLELVKEKPTMFVFYRGGWCPYCSRHMAALQQIEDEILEIGFQIVAISVDQPEFLKQTMEEIQPDYLLLSDSPALAIKGFGLAYTVDQSTVDRYKSVGLDLEKTSGFKHHILPVPAVYLVNQDGKVEFQYVNPDYKERINADFLLSAAKAFMES